VGRLVGIVSFFFLFLIKFCKDALVLLGTAVCRLGGLMGCGSYGSGGLCWYGIPHCRGGSKLDGTLL